MIYMVSSIYHYHLNGFFTRACKIKESPLDSKPNPSWVDNIHLWQIFVTQSFLLLVVLIHLGKWMEDLRCIILREMNGQLALDWPKWDTRTLAASLVCIYHVLRNKYGGYPATRRRGKAVKRLTQWKKVDPSITTDEAAIKLYLALKQVMGKQTLHLAEFKNHKIEKYIEVCFDALQWHIIQ